MPPGRPRKVHTIPLPYEVRLTPSDGEPIVFDLELIRSVCAKFVAFKEGGEATGAKLHQHCLFETIYSQAIVMNVLNKLVRSVQQDKTKSGNAVIGAYRPQHEGSEGYASKCGQTAFVDGQDEEWLSNCMKKNDEYRREQERTRKAKQRTEKSFQDECIDELCAAYQEMEHQPPPSSYVRDILERQVKHCKPFPARSQMEGMVLRIQWKLGSTDAVVAWQSKNLSGL